MPCGDALVEHQEYLKIGGFLYFCISQVVVGEMLSFFKGVKKYKNIQFWLAWLAPCHYPQLANGNGNRGIRLKHAPYMPVYSGFYHGMSHPGPLPCGEENCAPSLVQISSCPRSRGYRPEPKSELLVGNDKV